MVFLKMWYEFLWGFFYLLQYKTTVLFVFSSRVLIYIIFKKTFKAFSSLPLKSKNFEGFQGPLETLCNAYKNLSSVEHRLSIHFTLFICFYDL